MKNDFSPKFFYKHYKNNPISELLLIKFLLFKISIQLIKLKSNFFSFLNIFTIKKGRNSLETFGLKINVFKIVLYLKTKFLYKYFPKIIFPKNYL